jgi:hypothetical protein
MNMGAWLSRVIKPHCHRQQQQQQQQQQQPVDKVQHR